MRNKMMKKTNKTIANISLALLMTFALTGCGSTLDAASKIGKILMDPSTPVGKAEDRPSTLSLSFLAEKNINANEEGVPSPIQVQVVYLTEDSKLLESYYEQFSEGELKDILGKNYLDHQDYDLLPEQYKVISDITLDEKNRYLGVIAYYANPEKVQWRKVIKLDGMGHQYNVLVHIKKSEVEIKEYE